ncbi:ABC-2 transporter permease [Lysinibacillus sp. NPDC093712]|uniref:ABC-2 transporter permease n=1 Tax=Lysinibacillus sp. NPDC093712 TaxID=3390579 RepID=UPI003D01E476
MTALLVKDLMTIQRQLKTQVLYLLPILFISIVFEQGYFIFPFILFILIIQAVTAITYDELCDFDKYANTLPISKSEIVLSKYMLSLFLMFIALIIALPIIFIINHFTNNWETANYFLSFNLITAAALCMLALLLPIYIKFGSIKGRFVLIVLCFIPGLIIGLLDAYFANILLVASKLQHLSYLAPFIGLFILWLSSLISTAIYKRKEF